MAKDQDRSKWSPWAKNPRFESIAEAERRARRRLPASVFKGLQAGIDRGQTVSENVDAFTRLGFMSRAVVSSLDLKLSTPVMGTELAFPVMATPAGVQVMNPDGEVAVARAAASRGTALGLSSFGMKPIEEVVAANPKTFSQLYWIGGREGMLKRLERSAAAGAAGIILTAEWAFPSGRDWGSPEIPDKIGFKAALKFGPEAIVRPGWLWDWAKTGALPDLTAPNVAPAGEPAPTFGVAYAEFARTPGPTWEDVEWLRSQWDGPFMLKGVTRVDDARRAVDAGVSAISVSNHGGANLDGTPATIRLLHPIANAVGDQVEVIMDGGIRRGSDVVKALCLGAKAVMIGRANLWGLAANGQAGAENVLDIMRSGIESTMKALQVADVADLGPEHLIIPDGFHIVRGG
jgi:heme/flavin dehydrogenase (mycofactocin system)